MLLYSRRKILTALGLTSLLGSCGFTPLYSEGSAASDLHGMIEITAGKGRESFEMREHLIERFGFAKNAQYNLTYTYLADSEGLAVSASAEITRYNLSGISSFKVTDNASGTVVFSGVVKSKTAYSATSETYPTRIAEQDAQSRLALALAEQMITRISATSAQWAK